ncbi:MAG: exodeoxyribonuclease VII large subunit, partial [Rhodoferax sp.]|nr:exodeoxyribonuclease VII large subunit [Rhodoferax sp.]
LAQRLGPAARMGWGSHLQDWQQVQLALSAARGSALRTQGGRLDRMDWQLKGLDPTEVLQRGYAWLTDSNGRTVTKVAQVQTGEQLKATLSDGVVDLQVADQAPN